MNRTALANKHVLSGLFFIAVAVVFGVSASALRLGTFGRMGPGYLPMILTVLLALLGAILIGRTLLARAAGTDSESDYVTGSPPIRALLLVLGATLVFALTVKPLGFLPATVLALLLSIVASKRLGIVGAVVLTGALTASAWLIFTVGLGLYWPLLGPWLR
jgi:hypothetical protein